jgi:hypothetical protein
MFSTNSYQKGISQLVADTQPIVLFLEYHSFIASSKVIFSPIIYVSILLVIFQV